jgi:hypothetical protein
MWANSRGTVEIASPDPFVQPIVEENMLDDASDLARMRFIGRAKALGFSLADIAGLLDLSSRRNDDMAGMKRTAGQKLVEVDARIAELTRIRAALQALVDSCPGHGELESCPILHALDEASP